jgi:hypothetical protein
MVAAPSMPRSCRRGNNVHRPTLACARALAVLSQGVDSRYEFVPSVSQQTEKHVDCNDGCGRTIMKHHY